MPTARVTTRTSHIGALTVCTHNLTWTSWLLTAMNQIAIASTMAPTITLPGTRTRFLGCCIGVVPVGARPVGCVVCWPYGWLSVCPAVGSVGRGCGPLVIMISTLRRAWPDR